MSHPIPDLPDDPSALFHRLDEALDAQSDPPAAVDWPDPADDTETVVRGSPDPARAVNSPTLDMGPGTWDSNPSTLNPPMEPESYSTTHHGQRSTDSSAPRRTGRPPIFDAMKQHTFLRLVAVGFSTRQAASNVGVSPSTVREKVRTSREFASRYEDAKAQAIPTLAENIYHAGQRSWRASAWLLERLQPNQFGRRVGLGPDRAKIEEQKRQQREAERQRDNEYRLPAFLNDKVIHEFINRILGDEQVRRIAQAYLEQIEADDLAQDQPAESTQPQRAEPKPTAARDPAVDLLASIDSNTTREAPDSAGRLPDECSRLAPRDEASTASACCSQLAVASSSTSAADLCATDCSPSSPAPAPSSLDGKGESENASLTLPTISGRSEELA